MSRSAPANTQSGHLRVAVRLNLNGRGHTVEVEPRRTLLDALRHDCGLSGTKVGCDMGNCGACTVLLDGDSVYACLVLAVECEGRDIRTIEDEDVRTRALRDAIVEYDGLQCGFCTPGQVMSLRDLFEREDSPDDAAIVEAVSGNLCRCGAYRNIIDAARSVSRSTIGDASETS